MKEKEIAELRRRLRPDKNSITHIRGCYVNEKKEIISVFNQSMGIMPESESEKYLMFLKRSLSGTLGKNLLDISFSTQQVADSEEHRLLSALRSTELKEEAVVEQFYHQMIEHLAMDTNYLILLAYDLYDVPYRSKDGDRQDDASSDVFSYVLCSICPVKQTKPALGYVVAQNEFHNREIDWIVAPPELGFLFPAFDDRCTNIYGALYYTRSAEENHEDFVDAMFRTELPMPAAAQKETFERLLSQTLEEECSFDVVHSVQEQFSNLIEAHKVNQIPEPLTVSKEEVQDVLESCGISDERVTSFNQQFVSAFGEDTELSPRNLVDTKHLEVKTPDVIVHVNPQRSDLVQTKLIDGVKYILIRVDEDVTVNGVDIHIAEASAALATE